VRLNSDDLDSVRWDVKTDCQDDVLAIVARDQRLVSPSVNLIFPARQNKANSTICNRIGKSIRHGYRIGIVSTVIRVFETQRDRWW
jgi:hypothetical protein